MPWNSCESTRLFSRGTSNKWSCMTPLTIPSSNFIHPDQWNIVHISYNSLWGPWPASSMNNGRSVKLKNFRGGKNFITDSLHQSVSLKFRFSLPPKKVSHETHFVDGSVSFHIRINYWQHKTDTSEQLFCIPNKDDHAYLCYRISNTSPPALRPKPF